MKHSDDHSLFAWMRVDTLDRAKASPTHRLHGLLADHPSDFGEASASFKPCKPRIWSDSDPYYLSSRGLQIALPLKHVALNLYLAMLDCVDEESGDHIAIWLRRLDAEKTIFSRVFFDKLVLESSETVKSIQNTGLQLMYVRQTPYGPEELTSHLTYRCLRYRITPGPSTSTDHRLLRVINNIQSTDASWEWLEEQKFMNGALTDVVLHIKHVPSSEMVIVRIGCLSGFFIGFNAYHSADPKAAQLFNDENYTMDLHVPGEEIDLDLDRHECQVRLDIVNEIERKGEKTLIDLPTCFKMQLSIKTTRKDIGELVREQLISSRNDSWRTDFLED
ncbi:hypothetical protein HII31_05407 [Pseudocercospora fuligena]|uniref:Uncharacterized protein n=1 Tax=Pseudocercospora fuligena TaxID=685502 RepID=A0A8H6RM14_9PEZI|nr:hypothetical protein HII31_05407 [Pseudocercospora fuligena]